MDNDQFQQFVQQQFQILTEIQKDIRYLTKGQRNLEEGQRALAEGQRTLAERQSILEEGQRALAERQGILEEGQKEIQKNLTKLETRIEKDINKLETRIEKDINKLETRIENEVIDKIRALFDARQVHEDKFKRILNKLESIQIDAGYLVARVAQLEKVAK